jgi:hypothetical protein
MKGYKTRQSISFDCYVKIWLAHNAYTLKAPEMFRQNFDAPKVIFNKLQIFQNAQLTQLGLNYIPGQGSG